MPVPFNYLLDGVVLAGPISWVIVTPALTGLLRPWSWAYILMTRALVVFLGRSIPRGTAQGGSFLPRPA